MSLLFSLLMKMDAGQAKAELRALQGELSKGKTEVAGLGNAAAAADGKLDGLGAASTRAAAANERLAQSQTKVQATSHAAAGSVGNLVANFNDVGMMIAAGQSPLQLAIQQGTQITQVIGPMGAAGALRTMGSAFMAMLSPINLVTYGVIAFGAAAVQWFMSSGDAAKSFEDAIKDLQDTTKAYADSAGKASASQATLRKEFGLSTTEARKLLAIQADLDLRQAMRAANGTGRQIADELALDLSKGPKFGYGPELRLADLFDVDLIRADALGLVSAVVADFQKLESSISFDDKIAAAQALGESYRRAAMASGDISEAEDAVLEKINQQVLALMQLKGAREEAARAEVQRVIIDPAKEAISGFIDRGVEIAQALEILAALEQEASIRDLINQHGRESEQVALARVEAERAAYEEMVSGLDVSEALKNELMGAWDAANGLASARIAAAIEAALGPASALNSMLKSAAGWLGQLRAGYSVNTFKAGGLAAQYASYGQGRVAGEQAVRGESALYGGDGNVFTKDMVPARLGSGSGAGRGGSGGGGGAKSAREEKDAVAELIKKLREEQEVLAETDPVKREMLKYRKQMAEATTAEKAEIEALIRAETQLKAVQAAREYATEAVGDFLDQIIAKGGKASDVLRGLASQFLSMATRSVLSGSGWFADLLGISGGLFGGQAKADGGMIYGEGGPRADKVPVWASAGEFMVNARATARYRPVLERINSGAGLPGFADGGMIGGGRMGGAAFGTSAAAPNINIHIKGAMGNEEIRQMTAEGVRAGLKHYDTYVLPSRVDRIQRAPRDR